MKQFSAETSSRQADLFFIRQLMERPLLKRQEEHELVLAWHDDHDEEALHQLVQAYTRLVVSTAVRFRHYGIALSDLIQEGNLGLMYAAGRFDPDREVRFSSYAKWWVLSYIQEYILRNWSIVRTGSTTAQKQLFFRLRRLKSQLSKTSIDQMTPEERNQIAEILHVPLQEVEDMENRLSSNDLSLSHSVSEEEGSDWIDFLVDHKPDPETATLMIFDSHMHHLWIKGALDNLNPRERMIIRSRRLGDHPPTLESIGKKLRISKERVRQLEARAIDKMRDYLLHHLQDVKEVLS